MNRTFLLTIAVLALSFYARPGAAAPPDAASCAACHTGALSLADRPRDELAAALAAMAAGERAHPTELTGLDEAAIQQLIDALRP